VVVDNEGGPVPELPPSTRLIHNRENVGFARGPATRASPPPRGVRGARKPRHRGREGFFESLEKLFDENRRVGVVGPRIVDGEGTSSSRPARS
jgi:GT2 family glycosyltransferase